MKAIIYAGIGLFSIATIYGVADYYSSEKNGTLKKLYVDDEIAVTPKVEEKSTTVIPLLNTEVKPAEIKIFTAKARSAKKIKHSPKEIKFSDFSRARIPERMTKETVEDTPPKEGIVPDKIISIPAEKIIEKDDTNSKLKKTIKKY